MADEMHLQALRGALRALLLPIQAQHEDAAVDAAASWLAGKDVSGPDWRPWVEQRHQAWEDRPAEKMPSDLGQLIRVAVEAGFPDHGATLGSQYRNLHHDLTGRRLSPAEASSVLSYAPLISSLRSAHRMSASQIAKVITARSPLADVHWDVIQRVLSALDLSADRPDAEQLSDLTSHDRDNVGRWFGDADLAEGPMILQDVAARLGFKGNLRRLMMTLVPPDEEPHVAYLQILHVQLALAEFYDHPLTIGYEFSPRSTEWATIYADAWPDTMRAAENPILNNAKSVYELDEGWAKSKKDNLRPAAFALVDILQGLDAMSDRARDELASWLRAWLLRLVELIEPPPRDPIDLTPEMARGVLQAVASADTKTHGIIEQRLVDAIAVVRHQDPSWVSRGVGDSVFAPNYFRRKLGDCDFQDISARRAQAYESHGGRLSSVYLDSHLATLRRVIELRAADWTEEVGDPATWSLEVTFVAHEHEVDPPPILDADQYAGVSVTVKLESFDEAIELAGDPDQWLDVFRRHVHEPLTAPTSREDTYQAYRAMLGI